LAVAAKSDEGERQMKLFSTVNSPAG